MQDIIMGKNTIFEVLKYKKNSIIKVVTSKDKNDFLIKEIEKQKIPIEFVNKNTLTNMVKSDSHQNIIAFVKQRNYQNLKDFLKKMDEKSNSLILMIDSVFDPQNFGSILRIAQCFNVDALVFSKNRGVNITAVVTKAASGATELLNLIKVSNLAYAMEDFIDHGYETIASNLSDDSEDLYSFKFSKKTLIIVGSEEKGIQPILLKKSDHKIKIPMPGKLQSLNVSSATSILLSFFRYQAR